MNPFDKYLYEELAEEYEKDNLSSEDYEILFYRFKNLGHLEEARPFLFAMRYMGYGTPQEKESVISELEAVRSNGNPIMNGLYYDLLLFENQNHSNHFRKLKEMADQGYSDLYLKGESHLHAGDQKQAQTTTTTSTSVPDAEERIKTQNESEMSDREERAAPSSVPRRAELEDTDAILASSQESEKIVIKRMIFEGCGYSGFYFTAGDIDYLNARVYVEPVKTNRHLTVRSQIFAGDEPFSDVFTDEYTLTPGTEWFRTTGWGNSDFYGYENRVYQWRIEMDGKEVYCQNFRFFGGKIDKHGIRLTELKLFTSNSSGPTESELSDFKTSFDGSNMEYLYFRLFFNRLEEDKSIQVFLKIKCLEDNSVSRDEYFILGLNAGYRSCWFGFDFSKEARSKKGLYQYWLGFEQGLKYEGTFTVY